ncbi:MAG: ribbon-helix-helix domain-containing protein [Gemmatimonadaceae bacterium]|jgi:hypothetical protein|nr:ribbon-helix-helix domain-containing protein [Gemmatimonadaceae bacterium]
MSSFKRTTVYIDKDVHDRLVADAYRASCSISALIRAAIAQFLIERPRAPIPMSVGSGSSGRGSVAADADALLGGFGRS